MRHDFRARGVHCSSEATYRYFSDFERFECLDGGTDGVCGGVGRGGYKPLRDCDDYPCAREHESDYFYGCPTYDDSGWGRATGYIPECAQPVEHHDDHVDAAGTESDAASDQFFEHIYDSHHAELLYSERYWCDASGHMRCVDYDARAIKWLTDCQPGNGNDHR